MANAISEATGDTTRLGSYEIVRRLARGGMAEIYLARTRDTQGIAAPGRGGAAAWPRGGAERLVVLKKILPRYANKQRYVQLFLDEARLAATLDHPNIVKVFDIGMVDGSYFFTMEYLHGPDVREILHRTWRTGGTFPLAHAVQIARHIASALDFAHGKQGDDGRLLGIVHRDVSPSNVIVTFDGATKLLDFGVAKTVASTVKTRTGTLKGKIAYMSPEQARGAPIDRRSDIFALGIVLWEMVTTQRLFRADNDLATLQMIVHGQVRPPTSVRPECPPELERIVLRALAHDPDARYPSAAQIVHDLDALAVAQGFDASPGALASTLGQLFGVELAAWRQASAAGVPLAEHLNHAGDLTTPVSESDFIDPDYGLEDEDDDELDEDDDDLTEHAAPIVEALPPLTAEAATVAARPLNAAVRPSDPELDTVMLPMPSAPRPSTPHLPFPAVLGTSPGIGVASPRANGVVIEEKTIEIDAHRDMLPEDSVVNGAAPAPPLDPVAPVALGDSDDALDGPPATRMAAVPLSAIAAHNSSSVRFAAVPPWQSGQPSMAPTTSGTSERSGRSWAVVALPPIDPQTFARHRRNVIRAAAGLVFAILLVAILAGRC